MDVERVELAAGRAVGVRAVVPMDHLPDFMERAFGAAASVLARSGIASAGPAVAVYRGDVGASADVTAGFLVADGSASPGQQAGRLDGGDVADVALPAGPALVVRHVGPYDTLATTYARLEGWVADHGARTAELLWEEYLVGPGDDADPEHWVTRIVRPLR